jgi:hypothetical protein
MTPAITIAIGALIISIINSVYTAKTYKKSRRLEFLQRKDRLIQKISDLNDRNTEAHLISAKYRLVAVKIAGLPLRGEQAEQNTVHVASLKNTIDNIEKGIKIWDEEIEKLHVINHNLTLETDAPEVEKMIALVQIASDRLKHSNEELSSFLFFQETNTEYISTKLTEMYAIEKEMIQINIEYEREMAKLNIERIGS